MRDFDWNDFIKNKVAVKCDTEEKAKDFLSECHKRGFRWIPNKIAVDVTSDVTFWEKKKERTCYEYSKEYGGFAYGTMEVGYVKHRLVEWVID